jgi:hypothetical protein
MRYEGNSSPDCFVLFVDKISRMVFLQQYFFYPEYPKLYRKHVNLPRGVGGGTYLHLLANCELLPVALRSNIKFLNRGLPC